MLYLICSLLHWLILAFLCLYHSKMVFIHCFVYVPQNVCDDSVLVIVLLCIYGLVSHLKYDL